MTQAPSWAPEAAQQVWQGDHFSPPSGTLPLGDVPDGETVVIKLRQRTNVDVRANSVGYSGCFIEVHGQRAARAVLHAPFARVDVVAPETMTLELTGSPVNLHIRSPGRLNLAAQQESKVAAWVDDVAGNVRLVTEMPLTSLRGTADAVTLQPTTDGDPVLIPGAHVDLDADLTAQRSRLQIGSPDRLSTVSGHLTCATLEADSYVSVGAATLKAQDAQSNAALGGAVHLRASGPLIIDGAVTGTEASPVNIKLLDGAGATLVGQVSHASIAASRDPGGDGAAAGNVSLPASNHVHIENVTTVTSNGNGSHTSPHFTAVEKIEIQGGCSDVRHLEAAEVQIKGACTGPGTVKGEVINLAPSRGTDDKALQVHPGKSLHAAVPASLDIGVPDESSPVGVAVGTRSAPRVDLDPTDDGAFRTAVNGRGNDELSYLSVRGPVVLSLGRSVVCRDLTGVKVLAAGQSVELMEGAGLAAVESARVVGELAVSGRSWSGEYLHVEKQVRDCGHLDLAGAFRAHHVGNCAGSVGSLEVGADVTDSHLQVEGDAAIEGDVRHSAAAGDLDEVRLTVTGKASIAGDCEPGLQLASTGSLGGQAGHVVWHPDSPVRLTIADQVSSLSIRASTPDDQGHDGKFGGDERSDADESPGTDNGEMPSVDLGETGSVKQLTCQGAVRIAATNLSSGDSDNAIERLDLCHSSTTTLESSRAYAAPMKLRLPAGEARVHVRQGRAELKLVGDSAAGTCLELRGDAEVHAAESASDVAEIPVLLLNGGNIAVHGHVAEVRAKTWSGVDSTLAVHNDGTVHRLLGRVRLENVKGRVTGARPSLRARWMTGNPSVPPCVIAVKGDMTGVLVGVDVSRLTLNEIQALGPLEVFSPAPKPLRALAKRGTTSAEKQEIAQRLATIASEIEGRAVSGSVRTRADWAVARAHHRIAPRPEWIARWFSRAVGYSHRPAPALVTVVAVVVLVSRLLITQEAGTCEVESLGQVVEVELGDYTVGQNVQRLLGPTLSFLRLSSGGANLAPVWCNPFAQVGATLAVLLPLLFLVIALRHYLVDPSDQR